MCAHSLKLQSAELVVEKKRCLCLLDRRRSHHSRWCRRSASISPGSPECPRPRTGRGITRRKSPHPVDHPNPEACTTHKRNGKTEPEHQKVVGHHNRRGRWSGARCHCVCAFFSVCEKAITARADYAGAITIYFFLSVGVSRFPFDESGKRRLLLLLYVFPADLLHCPPLDFLGGWIEWSPARIPAAIERDAASKNETEEHGQNDGQAQCPAGKRRSGGGSWRASRHDVFVRARVHASAAERCILLLFRNKIDFFLLHRSALFLGEIFIARALRLGHFWFILDLRSDRIRIHNSRYYSVRPTRRCMNSSAQLRRSIRKLAARQRRLTQLDNSQLR